MNFSDLGLSDKVLSAVAGTGYTQPTPIQAKAIPHVLARRDVLGLAQTGTGKTASFVLPMLSVLERGRAKARMPRTLILEPTRELAAQVEDSFNRYGVNHKLTVALLIGGVSFSEQDRKIDRGADVVIATPGRLLDHLERGKLLLQGIEIFVIDEADRMLDMGFIPDVERIFKILPVTRQTLFFSATMPKEIQSLVDRFLPQAERVEVSPPTSAAETVAQSLVATGASPGEKRAVLRDQIAKAADLKNAIIFCNRKRDVGVLYRSLERHELPAGALHGDMDQRSRMATLDAFKRGDIKLLVASDVAARGLDIPDVSHVFNYDVPHHSEDYIHRIGRTGRAGRSGTAITLVSPEDSKSLAAIEKMLGKELPWTGDRPSADAGERKSSERGSRSRSRSGRSSSRGAPAPADADAARADSQRGAPASGGKTADKKEPARGRPDRKDRSGSDDRAGVVFAETPYVPAFLLRPVRIAEPDEDRQGEEEALASEEAVAAADQPAEDKPAKRRGGSRSASSRSRSSGRSSADAASPAKSESSSRSSRRRSGATSAKTPAGDTADARADGEGDTAADTDGEPALAV